MSRGFGVMKILSIGFIVLAGMLLKIADIYAAPVSSEVNLSEVTSEQIENQSETPNSKYSLNYFGILYGPSVQDPSSFQPTINGEPDPERPVIMKNFLWVNYNLTNEIAVAPSAYFIYQPVLGQQVELRDPFLRISHSSVLHTEQFNLYADIRWHIPVSNFSRESDLRTGIQTYQVASYTIPSSRFTFGAYVSERVNFYGRRGNGNDFELYLGPNVNYQLSPKVALTMLYEATASHALGDPAFQFNNDGTDLEPGVSWDITQNLNFNPYLNFYTGGKVNLRSTAVGALIAWRLI